MSKPGNKRKFCQLCGGEVKNTHSLMFAGKNIKVCFPCYDDIIPLLNEEQETKMEVERFYYNLILRLVESSKKGRE